MELKIEIYEIIIFMLIYGGLFLYIFRSISSRNKMVVYIKSAIIIILYVLSSTIIWLMYKGEEYHINNHSGYEPISFAGEAILMIVGFSIYNLILLLGIRLKGKKQPL